MAAVAENVIVTDDRQFSHRRTPSSPPPSAPSSDPASDFRDLVNLLSKLNPSAEEFVPSKFSGTFASPKPNRILSPDAPIFVAAGGADSDSGDLKDLSKDALNNSRRVTSLIPRAYQNSSVNFYFCLFRISRGKNRFLNFPLTDFRSCRESLM